MGKDSRWALLTLASDNEGCGYRSPPCATVDPQVSHRNPRFAPPMAFVRWTLDTDSCLDKHVLSEDEKKTKEYDALAFRYVSYGAIPCLAGYTIYSLLYETHRGWYSFIISTLTSFVYMFGFVSKPTHEFCCPTPTHTL